LSTAPARRRTISKPSSTEPPASLKSAHELAIRLTLAPGQMIGPGKIALLEGVRAEGSISGAARAMGMSYKRAWELVDEINSMFAKPAVLTSKGGKTGGGALLSDLGAELIRAYRALEEASLRMFHAQFADLRPVLRKRPARP
jgi:molybdate transport system regulatory protein